MNSYYLLLARFSTGGHRRRKMQRDYWYDVRRKLSDMDSPEVIGDGGKANAAQLGGRAVATQTVPVVLRPGMSAICWVTFLMRRRRVDFRKASFWDSLANRSLTSC